MTEHFPLPSTGELSGAARQDSLTARLSASFASALAHAARALKVQLPHALEIDAALDSGGDSLRGRLNVSLPGMDRRMARQVLHTADQTCAYWRLSPKNIDVVITLL
jgi:osmotically inducible protein OsmC